MMLERLVTVSLRLDSKLHVRRPKVYQNSWTEKRDTRLLKGKEVTSGPGQIYLFFRKKGEHLI